MNRKTLQILAGVLVILLAVGLYKAKTDAAKAEAHVRQLQSEIGEREADLRALRAEIAHLETPARVESLAERHLGLDIGGEETALPESQIDTRLPAPRGAKAQ